MNANILIQFGLYLIAVLALTKPLGIFIARAMEGTSRLSRLGRPVERVLYRLCGIDPGKEMSWKGYAIAVLVLNVLGVIVVYALQRWQAWLPLNPQHFPAVSPDSSFNTAVSFATNTNWQSYGGESTMSYLTQMLGLNVQNFLSAATSIAVAIAVIRGLARHTAQTIGNFWVDLTRCTLYILLPLSLLLSVILVGQGIVQNFDGYKEARTVEVTTYQQAKVDAQGNPVKDAKGNPVMEDAKTQAQTLPMGPAASQIAIKQVGSNGGGFFNVNSAHPYENPTPLSSFLEMLSILLIPASLVYTFGQMVGDRRQGWAIFSSMAIIFVVFTSVTIYYEQAGNPLLATLGVDQAAGALQGGGNMEGKEARLGVVNSAIWATAATVTSNGSAISMHDSYTPIGGLVLLASIQLSEVVFGGVGSGLYGMLVYVIIAVFIAGLMIGRTPEYLGKKIESFEIKMASLVILTMPLLALAGTAIAVVLDPGKAGVANPGAHGFSEILYAFSSAANNNGSAFGGLSANTPFYNSLLGIAIWFGRFVPIVAVLSIAGSLAAKKRVQPGLGTMPTHGPLFVSLLIGTVMLVGALTYLPALALGPVVEHLQMIGTH